MSARYANELEASAMDEPLPPLTDAQVQAGALPGESWEAARDRLESERVPAGLEWPELADEDRRPEYLRRLEARPCRVLMAQRFAELQAEQEATRHLSPRERFNRRAGVYWPAYAEWVSTLPASARVWAACAERLPDVRDTAYFYWVHTPGDQRATVCRYAGDGMWSRVSDGTLLSGARHWCVSLQDAPGTRSLTRSECYALARLSRLHKLPPFDDVYDEQGAWLWSLHLLNCQSSR